MPHTLRCPVFERRRGFTLVEAIIVVVFIVVILGVTIPWARERERARLQAVADAEPWEVFEFRARPTKEVFTDREFIVIHCEIVNPTNSWLAPPRWQNVFGLSFVGTDFVLSQYLRYPVYSDTPIAPGESAAFEARYFPFGVGTVEVRARFAKGQSNAFELAVEASDDSDLPTFDERIADFEWTQLNYRRVLTEVEMRMWKGRRTVFMEETKAAAENEGFCRWLILEPDGTQLAGGRLCFVERPIP